MCTAQVCLPSGLEVTLDWIASVEGMGASSISSALHLITLFPSSGDFNSSTNATNAPRTDCICE